MNIKLFRAQKSEWLLLSFYFFSFLFLVSYALVFCIAAYEGLQSAVSVGEHGKFLNLLFNSFEVVGKAFLLTVPLSFILSIFLVLCDGRSVGRGVEVLMRFFVQIPLVLVGAPIIFWMEGSNNNIIINIILCSLLVPRLSLRWFTVAQKIHSDIIEAALSIGMSFWHTLYFIYIKKCIKDFIAQLLILFVSTLGLVAPLLYFVNQVRSSEKLFIFQIFTESYNKAEFDQWAPAFVLLMFIFCLLSTLTNDSEKLFGEWNG